jgi:nitrogen fixation-related uncharacterized protein
MPDWFFYFVAFPFAGLVIASAVYALQWASKTGQLRDFEDGAKVIFDDEEPLGRPTDQIFHRHQSTEIPRASSPVVTRSR